MKKIFLIIIMSMFLFSCMKPGETNTNINLPKEAKILKEDNTHLYFKIGKRYYIRTFHGGHTGYTICEIDKEVLDEKY